MEIHGREVDVERGFEVWKRGKKEPELFFSYEQAKQYQRKNGGTLSYHTIAKED